MKSVRSIPVILTVDLLIISSYGGSLLAVVGRTRKSALRTIQWASRCIRHALDTRACHDPGRLTFIIFAQVGSKPCVLDNLPRLKRRIMPTSMMRIFAIRAAICLSGVVTTHPVLADGGSYDDCLLIGLRDARSHVASNYIQRSCYALYRNSEMLLPRERAYHECILQNMPGAREQFAIMRINAICTRRGQLGN
ncbi:VF_A0006 family four-cysteine protein (plasmid) [Paraburkholderia strydomiana]